jgi:hypothetical protein
MSAHQMVCHLKDCCLMATGDRRVTDVSSPLRRTVVKWMALYAPLPWPQNVPTVPETNQEGDGTCPVDFTRDLAEVEVLLKAIASARARRDWPAHPVFGRMSRTAWLRWAYLHTDHHLRQFGA